MTQDFTIEKLLKIIFDVKQEMSSYKEVTDAKIANLENTISIQQEQLNEKDNKIKTLNDTVDTMKEEHTKTVTIMQKEIVELRKENKNLKKEMKANDKHIKKISKKNDKLEKKNSKLENRLSKNSSNSSKPSSTDGFTKIAHGLRQKSSNPVGGQKNHAGSTLTEEKVKTIINSNADNVIIKKETLLVNNKKIDGTKKYKIDTELSIIVTEYNLGYDKGGEAYTDIKTYLSTMKKQGNNLYQSIRLAFSKTSIKIGV